MMKRLYLLLCLLGTLPVDLSLLLEMPDLASPPHELDETLVSDEQKDDQKNEQRNRILAPLFDLYRLPKLRKFHSYTVYFIKFAAKVLFFLHMCKFFYIFVPDLIQQAMKIRISLLSMLLSLMVLTAQAQIVINDTVHITIDNPSTWSGQALAPYAGKTVIFDVPMIVCANTNSKNGSYTVSPWRRFEPESHGLKFSPEYNETVRINKDCMFTLSGLNDDYHRCGEKIIGLTARINKLSEQVYSLTWKGGKWQGNTRADLEKSLPDLGDYRLLVCGFNLENYFVDHLGRDYMGADSYEDHQVQRAKVSKALKRINADVFGLVELELGNAAIKEITEDLNKNLPGRHYTYFTDGISDSKQKVDFVYDANVVEPVGTPVGTDTEIAHRKKMMCFREKATGEKFIYSINHFKAMSEGTNERRVKEANAVVKLYNSYRKDPLVKDNDALIMGDLNCHAFTDPIQTMINSGLIDLHRSFHADSSYSYMFGGMASYIDHAICSEQMYRQVTGMAAFHINSDEDDRFTYDGKWSDNTMFRCSDHDPVLVGLKLDSTLSLSLDPYVNNFQHGDSLTFYYVYTSEMEDPVVYFDIYTLNGTPVCGPTRIVYEGDIFEKHTKYYTLSTSNPNLPDEVKSFLPLQPGLYVLHFYNKGTVHSHKLLIR